MKNYQEAVHAMQTGVALELSRNPSSGTAKSLRVGINVALRDHGSLVNLLISKGIITAEEYQEAVTEGMNKEVEDYQDRLAAGSATKITLV